MKNFYKNACDKKLGLSDQTKKGKITNMQEKTQKPYKEIKHIRK